MSKTQPRTESEQRSIDFALSLLNPAKTSLELTRIIQDSNSAGTNLPDLRQDPVLLIDDEAPEMWDYYDRQTVVSAVDEIISSFIGLTKIGRQSWSPFVFLPLNPNVTLPMITTAYGNSGMARLVAASAFCMFNPMAHELAVEQEAYQFIADATFFPWFLKWKMNQDRLTLFRALTPVWHWWKTKNVFYHPNEIRAFAQAMLDSPDMNFKFEPKDPEDDDYEEEANMGIFQKLLSAKEQGLAGISTLGSPSYTMIGGSTLWNAYCYHRVQQEGPLGIDENQSPKYSFEILLGEYRAFDEVRKILGIPEQPNAFRSLF